MIISVKSTSGFTTLNLKFSDSEFIKLTKIVLEELEKSKEVMFKTREEKKNAQNK